MKEPQQISWTLWGSNLTVQVGTFVEYQHQTNSHQTFIAQVQTVRVVSVPPFQKKQVIDVKRSGHVSKRDGQRFQTVLSSQVLRVLDGAPPPAPRALTSFWSPRDQQNPFQVKSTLGNEEWKQIALWYPFSMRVFILQDGVGRWHEQARTRAWHEAKEAMIELARLHEEKPFWLCWVGMKCERRGKEGREKPVIWYPDQWTVEQAIRKENSQKWELSPSVIGEEADETMPIDWKDLNKRQQDYLESIYCADQEVEAAERSRGPFGSKKRQASGWRPMPYASILPSTLPLPVKKHLNWTNQISEGTGMTLLALKKRGLIVLQHLTVSELHNQGILEEWEWLLEEGRVPVIQITPAGRKLVREALNLSARKYVVGTLQEWHWRALAKAYTAGDEGVKSERIGYGRIGWNTWLRLRDYKIKGIEYPLVKEQNGISITGFGIGYYERTFVRYHDLYPDVIAQEPGESHDPLLPFVEMVQDHRTCQACQGKYLVEITRTYQQSRTWTWSVAEQERRIAGMVKSRYHEIEQCSCQEGEITETIMPLLALLDLCITDGMELHFPYHNWYPSLDYLVGGVASGREKRWHNAGLVQQKLSPLASTPNLEEERNVMKGTVRYCLNERTQKGGIYPLAAPGALSQIPVALTRKLRIISDPLFELGRSNEHVVIEIPEQENLRDV